MQSLKTLFDKHGTDRGSHHNYSELYETHLKHLKDETFNLLEVGIGSPYSCEMFQRKKQYNPGAGLRTWKEYFPNANIYGADINKNVLFSENRILTEWVDQYKADTIKALFKGVTFKVIIDDGCHEFNANKLLLQTIFHRLEDGGVYVIEDIHKHLRQKWEDFLTANKFNGKFYQISGTNLADNNLVIIKK